MVEASPRLREWPVGRTYRSTRLSKQDLLLRMQAIARAPMFADIPKRNLRSIARVMSVRAFPAGATLMKEGTPGSSFLLILDGDTKVTRRGRTIGRGAAGDFFGEISLLDPGPRTATVLATTDLTCLDLAGQDFRRILAAEPSLALRLLKGLARRFRETRPAEGP